MCGIAGIWSFREGVDEAVLRSMTDALVHRGPDDSGIYIDERNRVGFGHRRLSILDLSPLGHQPMSNDNDLSACLRWQYGIKEKKNYFF